MRVGILILCLLFSVSTLAHTKILLLGDSLSAAYGIAPANSWVEIIRKDLNIACSEPPELINASISGDRSENALARLPDLLKTHHPNSVWVEIGSNDGLRGTKIADLTQSLDQIIKLSQASGAKVVLFELKLPPNYGDKYTGQFNQVFHQLASKYKLPLIPYLLQPVADKVQYIQADNLHPNDEAQPLIAEALWQNLKKVGCTRE